MILLVSTFVTDQRPVNRYSRIDILKYMLKSYAQIPFTEAYFQIELDQNYKTQESALTQYITELFQPRLSVDRIHFSHKRFDAQSEWEPFIKQLEAKHGPDELVWFMQNDSHIFVDFNCDVLNEGVVLLQSDPAPFKSLYLSHWPEILRLSGKNNTPTHLGNYVKFTLTLFDGIQIFNMKLLHFLFITYRWPKRFPRIDAVLNEIVAQPAIDTSPEVPQVVYVPLRELVRRFDGYDHVNMKPNMALELPDNTFPYDALSLRQKMVPKISSPWTANNTFSIPESWVQQNHALHQGISSYTLSMSTNSIRHDATIQKTRETTKNSDQLSGVEETEDSSVSILVIIGFCLSVILLLGLFLVCIFVRFPSQPNSSVTLTLSGSNLDLSF